MKTNRLLIVLVLITALLLSSCGVAKVGALRNESQSVELGDAKSVSVAINLGAGDLQLSGGAQKLMEADFTYNVAKLKPEVEYKDGTLTVQQPEVKGVSSLVGITDFRNEWGVKLNDGVPMDLSVGVGAGTGTVHLGGLSLSGLKVSFGAGTYTVDLGGNWTRNLDVTIDTGAALLTVQLPKDVGVRVKVESGPHTIDAPGLTKDGEFYTNAAYGVSDVTLQIDLASGIGTINLMEIGQ